MELEFYEKPGCKNNTKQKKWLEKAGCRLETKDLLTHPFDKAELALFFANRPREQWFNPTAPRLKSGEFDPAKLSDDQVFEAMLADRLLIKRPLIKIDKTRLVGFVPEQLENLGLSGLSQIQAEEMTACKETKPCPEPAE